MFAPCAKFENENTPLYVGCNASYIWTYGFTFLILAGFFYLLFKSLRSSIKHKTSFWRQLISGLNAPVKKSFCYYLSDSSSRNFMVYYIIMIAAAYGDGLLKILPSLAGADMTFLNITLRAFVPVSRAASLFVWFLVLEIIHLRYYYFRANKVNLLTSAVDMAERRIASRFILLKALIFSFSIFIAEEVLTFEYFQSFRESCTKYPLFFYVRFLEFIFIFCMTIPRLSFLFYEKRRQDRSEALFRDHQVLALLSKHLDNLAITPDSAEDLIRELAESVDYCRDCSRIGKAVCIHSLESLLEERITISYARFEEQRTIASTSLAPMLASNPRDNVGLLKLALVFLLINSLLIAFNYLVLAVAIHRGVNIIQTTFNWMRIICCIINLAVVPWLYFLVLNPDLSFGKFHPVFESEELEESQQIQRQKTNSSSASRGIHLPPISAASTDYVFDYQLTKPLTALEM